MNKRFLVALIVSAILVVAGMQIVEGETNPPLRPLRKEVYPPEDTIQGHLPPNVFFLLDVGSPMTFTPTGIMPLREDGKTTQEHIEMFAQSTYGTGARPLSTLSGTTLTELNPNGYATNGTGVGNSRFGRDLDSSNNIIGNPDCYYTPDPSRPYLLTFKDRNLANWNGQGNPPSFNIDTSLSDVINKTHMQMVSQLLSYLPGGANAGQPITDKDLINAYLVPNDSRMYQMKLVLWRMLLENDQLLSQMRVAMGTSYFETNYGYTNILADFYKNYPYDRATYNRIDFINGAGPSWTDDILARYAGSNAYKNSQRAFSGILRDLYDSTNQREWFRVNRAVMHVPFDYLYTISREGNYEPADNLTRFQQYLDGIETVDRSISGAIVNPEFFADGKTPLSTAVYGHGNIPGKTINMESGTDIRGNSFIKYATSASGNTVIDYGDNTRLDLGLKYRLSDERSFAGKAVGSVIDFFSPQTNKLAFSRTGTANTVGYFPIVGACQKNWLVVFTAANDSDGRTAEESVKMLFENSLRARGRVLNNSTGNWEERPYIDMYSGIRTLVVGFVDPDESKPETSALRTTLTNMAQEGDPIRNDDGSYRKNPNALPFFANDVPSLIASLKAVLLRITANRFAASAPTITPAVQEDEEGTGALYVPYYQVMPLDQWQGFFKKFQLDEEEKAKEVWELNANMRANMNNRNLYTIASGAGSESTEAVRLDGIPQGSFANLSGVPQNDVDKFRSWLKTYRAGSILGDMEHSGYLVVGQAGKDTGIAKRAKTIYLQTNRGFLHSVNESDGQENWAFMPPNILEGRAKAMKFLDDNTWIESTSDYHLNSFPMDLLDGGMVQKDVRFGDNSYNSVLIANLGWGGNGFYAMDITHPNAEPRMPKFLWAVDNARYETLEPNSVKRWGKAATASGNYDYSDLGLTIVYPVLMRVRMDADTDATQDVGLLPAGLGYALGDDNQGKALYVFEPENASIIRKMTGDASTFLAPPGRDLGMLIAPVTHVYDYFGNTSSFYTADSEGNILYCDTQAKKVDHWQLESLLQIKTEDGTQGVSIPKGLAIADAPRGGGRWIFAGTADVMVPDYHDNRNMDNSEQYIVGFNSTNTTYLEDLTTNSPSIFKLNYQSDGIESTYGTSEKNSSDASYRGWCLKLRPPTATTGQEYVTTSPYLYGGILYVSTFIPKFPYGDDPEDCEKTGDSKLYALNPATGAGMWSNQSQALVIQNAKISGLSAFDGKLYIGLKKFNTSIYNSGPIMPDELNAVAIDPEEALYMLDSAGGGGNPPDWEPHIPFIHYWQERFAS